VLTQWGDNLKMGTQVIDTTTGAPEQMAAFGSELKKRDVWYLDATVAGSSAQVRSGEVTVLVGGEEEAFQACQPYFEAFARHTFHVGPHGSGAKMKLVHNLILGLHRAVLAEGLALAETLELELPRVLETSESNAGLFDRHGDQGAENDRRRLFRSGNHRPTPQGRPTDPGRSRANGSLAPTIPPCTTTC
jgi:3-hydroxyisobutyrate dehydrogenase-like beta-hydroxyacid dehydrogenase